MGVDRAVVYNLAGRGWGLLSGVLTLLLVMIFLTPDEQGYYYTFASILAMQIFFELGMSYVVMQFASHEMANLSWVEDKYIQGDIKAKGRLRSLLILVMKWYAVIAILVVLVILPIGIFFFSINHERDSVNWLFAWTFLVMSSAVNIFIAPTLSILEGCGRILEIAKLRMYQGIFGSVVSWVVLTQGGGLFSLPSMSLTYALVAIIWLQNTKKTFLIKLIKEKTGDFRVSWKTEIWPLQWRIALSWLSGYFIFQLFTPILFYYHGAAEAGKMGLSISIANALMSVAVAWISTQAPSFGTLIAKKDYINLDLIFKTTLAHSLFVMILLALVLCIANYLLHEMGVKFSSRVLDPLPFALLIGATVLNYVTYAQSTYLRAHKQEPFLVISLVSAVLIGVLTLLLGREYGALGIMYAYSTICAIVGFGWGSWIFLVKRKAWS